jgi:hypothetical protein
LTENDNVSEIDTSSLFSNIESALQESFAKQQSSPLALDDKTYQQKQKQQQQHDEDTMRRILSSGWDRVPSYQTTTVTRAPSSKLKPTHDDSVLSPSIDTQQFQPSPLLNSTKPPKRAPPPKPPS